MSSEGPASDPRAMEPLLPSRQRGRLVAASRQVAVDSLSLRDAAHPTTVESLRDLLREMNSYYSNRIEGQATHPLDIAAALRSEFDADPDRRRLQRLAIAHIDAERVLEGPQLHEVLTVGFLRRAHAELYERAGDAEIGAGAFRTMNVQVGRHVAPEPAALSAFGARFDTFYGRSWSVDETLLAAAAAHHRATWIHPFEDGNGRAIRLQTHCALFALSGGLWSVSRGLARRREEYYLLLAEADAPRAGDLDGRGNLSDAALGRWCEWFIDVCSNQVAFMRTLLDLDTVGRRLRSLLAARSAEDSRYRVETATALHHLFATGPASRSTFLAMTGLGERTARAALSHLLSVGIVTSPNHRAPVRIAFPLDTLALLFPDLYPEAATTRR